MLKMSFKFTQLLISKLSIEIPLGKILNPTKGLRRLFSVCIVLLLNSTASQAQIPHFKHYTVNDGLPSSYVYTTFQDSKGFVWIATDKGVAQFDGYRFKKFTTANGLSTNDVWNICEDAQGRIWFSCFAKRVCYYSHQDQRLHSVWLDKAKIDYIFEVRQPNPKQVMLVTSKKSYVIENNKKKTITNNISHSGIPSDGLSQYIYTYLKEQVPYTYQYDGYKNSTVLKIPYNNDQFYRFTYNRNNQYFFWTVNQITRTVPNQNEIRVDLQTLGLAADEHIDYLRFASETIIFVHTSKQSFLIDTNLKRLTEFDYIRSFEVNQARFDDEQNLWISTRNDGLYLLSRDAALARSFESFREQGITKLLLADTTLWIGTKQGQIYRYKNKNLQHVDLLGYQTASPIIDMTTDKQQHLWVSWQDGYVTNLPTNNQGVFKTKKTSKITSFEKTDYVEKGHSTIEIMNATSKAVLHSLTGSIWCASHGDLREYRDTASSWRINRRIASARSKVLAEDSKGRIWVGRIDGLSVLKDGVLNELTILKKNNDLLNNPINAIYCNADGSLWVGTDGWGLYRFENGKTQSIAELKGNSVQSIHADKDGNLWLATNAGVYVLTVKYVSPLIYSIQRISIAQGLPSQEINDVCILNNAVYVASNAGLSVFDRLQILNKQANVSFPLLIRQVSVNRKPLKIKTNYELDYTQNSIDIDFVGLSYRSDGNIRYEYRLKNSSMLSAIWKPTADSHIEFPNLAPDQYRLEIRAFDVNNQPNEPLPPIVFNINPPFWDRLGFRLAMIGLVLVLAGIAAWLRVYYVNKKESEKTAVNKRFAELELHALQAQMNPHFVFNALTAIQNFILQNDSEKAIGYLTKFSRLMRLFLESSREKYISLSDELQLLKIYVDLEQVRFRDKFKVEFLIDENVNQTIQIPSMLIQPFVENAINHGLVYLDENSDGLLQISFKKTENILYCTIKDNGIGRQQADEMKRRSNKPYRSRGMEITAERIKTLHDIDKLNVKISIIDNTNPTGTLVQIAISQNTLPSNHT
jgi:ligand-binding sensor domain-containing protein